MSRRGKQEDGSKADVLGRFEYDLLPDGGVAWVGLGRLKLELQLVGHVEQYESGCHDSTS